MFYSLQPFIDKVPKIFIQVDNGFRKWVVNPFGFCTSASIKSVFPAIDPTFSYDNLEIGDGGAASSVFLSMIEDAFIGNEPETRNTLLKYCERDTEGMVVIWKELRRLIK